MLYVAPIATTGTTICFTPEGCPPAHHGPGGGEVLFAIVLLVYGVAGPLAPSLAFDLTHLFGYAEPPKPSPGRLVWIRVTGGVSILIAASIVRSALTA